MYFKFGIIFGGEIKITKSKSQTVPEKYFLNTEFFPVLIIMIIIITDTP